MDTPRTSGFAPALAAARRLHRSGGGTVLDALLQATGREDWPRLFDWLQRHAGVHVAADPGSATLATDTLDADTARWLHCIPLRLNGEPTVRIGLADPWDEEQVQRIADRLGTLPPLVAVSSAWLAPAGPAGPAVSAGGAESLAPGSAAVGGPVVDFVDAALRGAYASAASDIHFECDRGGVTVKFRRDGVMLRFARLSDPQRAEEVISRIKVLSQLDITERRVPQDGRFRFVHATAAVDLRVSIMPSVHGEDAVLRLLDKAQLRGSEQAVTLDRLGFDDASAGALRNLADLPHGMLLVTGPTGSGKTTTVYAVLSEVNQGLEKIITIEDPVEYELPGVLQIPVNDRKGLTFARGLRSILRHDPDRILVGEIRDAETAEIAVQSALTGHQVFTTVHANNLFDVIGRFRHFGLDMYGFMSALNGVVVQRLLRTLCPLCCGQEAADERGQAWLATMGQSSARVPVARGCEHCHGTGYKGRLVLAEVHAIDDTLRDLVTSQAPLTRLREQVQHGGAKSLHLQSAALVAAGRTSLEEVRRVVGWR